MGGGGVRATAGGGGAFPGGVVAAKARVCGPAPAAIVTVMGRLLAVPPVPIVAVTPLPLKLTAVAPPRSDPLMVAPRLLPAAPEDGVIPEIIGTGSAVKACTKGAITAGGVTPRAR